MRVMQVDPELTIRLRQRVLRPHQTTAEIAVETTGARTVAFAAYDGDEVVGTAIINPEAFPDRPDTAPSWRLRGMATSPHLRGRGVGGQVLDAVIDHVASAGGGLLWCNARTPAQRFYERAGFGTVGEPWDEPQIGPHIRMWRHV